MNIHSRKENTESVNNNQKRMAKIEYSDVIVDKDELIGGRREEDGQILQPIRHLSGIQNLKPSVNKYCENIKII